jgi:glycosyltransferase involved in cell wall biosynthesis
MSKIIFNIIQSNVAGGMENVFLDYSKILKQNNFNLIAVTSKNFVHLQELKNSGIQTEVLNISGHFDFIAAIKLWFLIKKYSPQLIIAHNGRSFAALNLARKLFNFQNLKLLAISHGGGVKRILNFGYIISVAKHIEEKIRAKNFKGKIQTIHNGVKIISYEKIKKSGNNFNFGLMSRLSAEKNIEIAINAFAKLPFENSALIIAGEGPKMNDLKQLAKNLNIENKVKFIGWIKDKKTFFDEIDVFLQPSLNEPFGLTILEAFNYKTPVIAANVFGPKEIIKNNLTGFLFEAKSADSLTQIMEKIYENISQNIIENAYQHLIADFSYEKMAQNLVTFINMILNEKSLG